MSNKTVLPPDMRLKQSSNIIASEVDGEVVMMSIDQGKYFGLDSIGSDIWLKLKEPQSIKSLCIYLDGKYNAEFEQIEKDLMPFIEDLVENDILEILS